MRPVALAANRARAALTRTARPAAGRTTAAASRRRAAEGAVERPETAGGRATAAKRATAANPAAAGERATVESPAAAAPPGRAEKTPAAVAARPIRPATRRWWIPRNIRRVRVARAVTASRTTSSRRG